jgi:microcystin-dependent protein
MTQIPKDPSMFNTLKTHGAVALVALAATLAVPGAADAQEKYLGEIFMGGWNFCPRGSARLDGQLLAIANYNALFALLGTQYGGDGRTTFALPDMRGRFVTHPGQGPGLSPRVQGQSGGTETNTLTVNQLPAHSHGLTGTTAAANTPSPGGALPATTGRDSSYAPGSADAPMAAGAVGNAGGGQAVNNMPPFGVVMWCIVTQGIFPSRS